jgi:hypothetical protein
MRLLVYVKDRLPISDAQCLSTTLSDLDRALMLYSRSNIDGQRAIGK